MINLIPKKYIVIFGLIFALGFVLWFWRGEIIKRAENAYSALISQRTIEINERSKKESENVRKEVQSFNDRQLDARLCKLGIVQDNACDRK